MLRGAAILLIVGLAATGARAQITPVLNPFQTLPQSNASFIANLQQWLSNEIYQERNEWCPLGAVVTGCLGPTSGSLTHTLSPCTAYAGGYRITDLGSITYPDGSTCTVIANQGTTGTFIGNWVRVAGTHYLYNCVAAAPAPIPFGSTILMVVQTTGGAITSVVDYRILLTGNGLPLGIVLRQSQGSNAIVTNSTSETPLFNPGLVTETGGWRVGSTLRWTASGTLKSTNAANTTTLRLYLGQVGGTLTPICQAGFATGVITSNTAQAFYLSGTATVRTPTSIVCGFLLGTGIETIVEGQTTTLPTTLSGPLASQVTGQNGNASANDFLSLDQTVIEETY